MSEDTAAASLSDPPKTSTKVSPQVQDDGPSVPEAEDLDELIDQIASADLPTRFFGVQSLRRRITDDCQFSYAKLVRAKNAFDVILASLGSDAAPDLQFECVWILNNLLSNHTHERPELLTHCEAMCQPLVKLLTRAEDRIREQACWALANIVGECADTRDQALACGLLAALIGLWESQPSAGVLDATSLLMVNLFRDHEPRIDFEAVKTLLPHMVKLLDHPHTAIVPHVVWAMSYMIEENEPRIRLLLNEDILAHLRRYVATNDEALLIPTLRLFGSISSKMELLPSCVLAGGLLAKMCPLLDHPDQKVRRQVLFLVSNISGGPDSNLQKIVDSGFLPKLGSTLLEGDEIEKREAFWVVPNLIITKGCKFKKLAIEHCLEGFIGILSLGDKELTNCVLVTVRELLLGTILHAEWGIDFDTLRKRIEHFGGLKKIELVQQMEDKNLATMSQQIICDFFWNKGQKFINEYKENESASYEDTVQPSNDEGPTVHPGLSQSEPPVAEQQPTGAE